jgi:hypothetical protein
MIRDPVALVEIAELKAERDRLREAMTEAIDLLLERTYGSPARSPGHNARLVLQAALKAEEVGK